MPKHKHSYNLCLNRCFEGMAAVSSRSHLRVMYACFSQIVSRKSMVLSTQTLKADHIDGA